MTILAVSCPDPRVTEDLDKLNARYARKAGANARGLIKTIIKEVERGDIESILILPHTDCAAMGLVLDVRKGMKIDPRLEEALVQIFSGVEDLGSRDNLERKVNLEKQIQVLKEAGFKEVKGSVIETKHSDVHGSVLALMRPSSDKTIPTLQAAGLDYQKTFVSQAHLLEELIPDIVLFTTKKGVREIVLVPKTSTEEGEFKEWAKLIRNLPECKDNKVNVQVAEVRSRVPTRG